MLIVLILLHSGRGGGLSEMFGGGLGSAAAGSTGVERNLDRITVVTAVVFSFTTVILAIRLQWKAPLRARAPSPGPPRCGRARRPKATNRQPRGGEVSTREMREA